MSQIEPDDYNYQPPFPPPDMDPEEFYDDEMESRGFQPGFRPPGPRPPPGRPPGRPPFGHRPGPPMGWFPERWGKYQWPFWGHWGYRLRNAWQDVKYLSELIQDVVVGMISAGIVAPGPNSPVPGPAGPPGATTGVTVGPNAPVNPTTGQLWYNTTTDALMVWDGTKWAGTGTAAGVTDGSNAVAGQVGEFLTFNQTGSYTSNQGPGTGVVVNAGTLPAGDWDVWATAAFSGTLTGPAGHPMSYIQGSNLSLQPVPTGFSSNMWAAAYAFDQAADLVINPSPLATPVVRASLTTATPLLFWLGYNDVASDITSLDNGTWVVTVNARRVR